MQHQSPYTSLIVLEGTDTIDLLERIVTCRVDDLNSGDHRPGALLAPQGKVISDFHLTRTETGVTLRLHHDMTADLVKRLKMFRLRANVDITTEETSAPRLDERARIDAVLPAYGADFTASEVFPTDINLDLRGGIDYKKGCFVGQEVVSRMMRRGKIRKRTVLLSGKGLTKGAFVTAGDKRLGQITSATDTAALAILRIDHLADAIDQHISLTSDQNPVRAILPDWLAGEMEALKNANT